MIEVVDLAVSYGSFRLRDIDFSLEAGKHLAVLGPSGAGKTLLLETVMGARRPERGKVLLNGINLSELPPESRGIGYIPQDLALFPHLSVWENIVFGLRHVSDRRSIKDSVLEVASLLGIEDVLERKNVLTLSGGEQQRVALARALIVKPRVLFLDEPFSALDASIRGDLLRSFRNLFRELSITTFFVTHDLDEVLILSDEVMVMMDGRIVRRGNCLDVYRNPERLDVARLLNIRNFLPASVIPHAVLDEVCGEVRNTLVFGIRPEYTHISFDGSCIENSLVARLIDVIPMSTHLLLLLETADGISIEGFCPLSFEKAAKAKLGYEVHIILSHENLIPLTDVT